MSKEIAKKEKHEVSTEKVIGMGFEHVDFSEISMPTAKLLQPTSEELNDDSLDFKAGNVIHSLLLEKLPDNFVPIMFTAPSKMFFVPKNDADKARVKELLNLTDDDMEGMFICRSIDGRTGTRYGDCNACGLFQFDGNEKPLCANSINVLCLFEGYEMPVLQQFTLTSYKHGKKFRDMTLFGSSKQHPNLFDKKYRLAVVKKQESGNTWYEKTVKPNGFTTEEEKEMARNLYAKFAGKVVFADDVETTEKSETETDY
jgi:hypothetical protein